MDNQGGLSGFFEGIQPIENYFGDKRMDVRSVSCDMSAGYKKLCKELFPNASIVIDK
ncbi:MAG: transposase, partial [Candidatus Saccharimonadales bacterium]